MSYYAALAAPATDAIPVTPNDNVDVNNGAPCRLLVGTAGAAKLTMSNGSIRTSVPLQQGYNPLLVIRVWSTGTTAANIHALP